MLLVKKFSCLIYLFSVKIILEKRFNNVVDRKGTFFGHKKNRIFPKGLTHAFGQKIQLSYLFVFGQNNTREKV